MVEGGRAAHHLPAHHEPAHVAGHHGRRGRIDHLMHLSGVVMRIVMMIMMMVSVVVVVMKRRSGGVLRKVVRRGVVMRRHGRGRHSRRGRHRRVCVDVRAELAARAVRWLALVAVQRVARAAVLSEVGRGAHFAVEQRGVMGGGGGGCGGRGRRGRRRRGGRGRGGTGRGGDARRGGQARGGRRVRVRVRREGLLTRGVFSAAAPEGRSVGVA